MLEIDFKLMKRNKILKLGEKGLGLSCEQKKVLETSSSVLLVKNRTCTETKEIFELF